jgi:hypothetical protein
MQFKSTPRYHVCCHVHTDHDRGTRPGLGRQGVRASGRQGGGLTLRWTSPEGFNGCMRGENLPMTLTSARPVLPQNTRQRDIT